MVFRNSAEKLREWHESMLNLVSERGYVLISGKMTENQRQKCYLIYCPHHDHSWETSFFNFQRSKKGCLLCATGAFGGRDSVSDHLTNRVFSEETLSRMRAGARLRPLRGGRPRHWRRTHDYLTWAATVRNDWTEV